MYHLLSGVSACKGSAWPAYTGSAYISSSVWGVGLQGFCMAGLYRMCRDIIFCLGCRPARVLHGRPIQDVQRYHLLSGVSACKGSAWPAYTGCAEISSSVWGVGLQGFCMAGLYRLCRGMIFCLGCRPARVLHGRPIQVVQRYDLLSGVSAC